MSGQQASLIAVRVVYAHTDGIWERRLELESPVTIAQAIEQSDFLTVYPGLVPGQATYGVFGKIQGADYVLHNHDRVEIYRALTFDPKTSRRRRAIHRQKARNIKKKVPINDMTQ